ncbi:GlxA family transcriptional regulator [Pseudomonas borbori]|uniref:Transcriptional regulator, AraC family with amidase-like domain n=1 Tax=Pseudomonas borbori TaxID=289003 RepID=A0A1I5U794_9PSED|nr:helix-turn-helix domain-containing protein [Pseudomonas borbori]SFP91114.1 transcriptional regulator, AraC family with amidase-like domain [Pseudomonas borbori]
MPIQKIGLLLYPGCMPAGLFAFADLLVAANRRIGQPRFQLCWVGLDSQPVECAQGMRLQPQSSLADAAFTAMLIPGLWADSQARIVRALEANGGLLRALAQLPRTTQLWSYCTGVCLLAQSGRLNGERATATWWLAPSLQTRFPKVDWQFEQAHITNPLNMTASGVSGYLSIARALIEQQMGEATYRDIARLMVLPRPEPATSVFRSINLMENADPLLRRLHLLVERLPAQQLSVQRLADELAVSARTLARKVQTLTGNAVSDQVRLIKLNQAGERLIVTSDSVSRISAALGYSDESSFRRTFKQVTGMTPATYRQQFKR